MGFFIADAIAATNNAATTAAMHTSPSSAAPGGDFFSLFMIAAIFVVFYFMLIRPQNKRAKEHRELVTNLKKGDEVVTSGGMLAKVISLSDQYLKVSLADGVEINLQRAAVSAVLPKGTIKSL